MALVKLDENGCYVRRCAYCPATYRCHFSHRNDKRVAYALCYKCSSGYHEKPKQAQGAWIEEALVDWMMLYFETAKGKLDVC